MAKDIAPAILFAEFWRSLRSIIMFGVNVALTQFPRETPKVRTDFGEKIKREFHEHTEKASSAEWSRVLCLTDQAGR